MKIIMAKAAKNGVINVSAYEMAASMAKIIISMADNITIIVMK
jgi:hypothetical protein